MRPLDGLLIASIHSNVTRFDFLDYLFVTALFYMATKYVWLSGENVMIHRLLWLLENAMGLYVLAAKQCNDGWIIYIVNLK